MRFRHEVDSLEPVEGEFSFPKDTGWLKQVMISFGQMASGDDDFFLPLPTGFNPDDHPSETWLFEDIVNVAWGPSMYGVAEYVGHHFESDPPASPQERIDRTIALTGGYPLPRSVRNLDRLVELTSVEPAEAMSWVWADRWSPERLGAELKDALQPLRSTLELTLLTAKERPAHKDALRLMAIDFSQTFRPLFQALLSRHFGDDWMSLAIDPETLAELREMRDRKGGKRTEFDCVELAMLSRLTSRHWVVVLEPFFVDYARRTKTEPFGKKAFASLLSKLIVIRNEAAHPPVHLSSEQIGVLKYAHAWVSGWLAALDGYLGESSA
jgi:hypothetical protein